MGNCDLHSTNQEITLASSSPQRQRLLENAGYSVRIVPPRPTAECGICSRETPPELVARLAWQKAADVIPRLAGTALVLACDTVAECRGAILGKPAGRDHARQMLLRMRGREHSVYSGVCLWRRPGEKRLVEVDRTRLIMDDVSDADLERYLATGAWQGKAGAFGYQDGLDWVRIIEGSESNVIGLPMELLARMLDRLDAS